jgi:hypothetical protein
LSADSDGDSDNQRRTVETHKADVVMTETALEHLA